MSIMNAHSDHLEAIASFNKKSQERTQTMDARDLLMIILALMASGASSTTFTFKNNCKYTVWPGTLTSGGSTQLSSTGFELKPGASQSINAPTPWTGRFWARTNCTTTVTGMGSHAGIVIMTGSQIWARTDCTTASGKFKCSTADCGSGEIACRGAGAIPPATLVEFTLATGKGQDFYDVSLVDGFNLPISVTPQGGSGCESTSCPANVNSVCPPELSLKGSGGTVVACTSACEAFNEPRYCCTGQFGSPTTCPPTKYSKIFKKACPQAYSYAYDDNTSTYTCTGGANYLITFCT